MKKKSSKKNLRQKKAARQIVVSGDARVARQEFIKKLFIIVVLIVLLIALSWLFLFVLEKIEDQLEKEGGGLGGELPSGPIGISGSGDYCVQDDDCHNDIIGLPYCGTDRNVYRTNTIYSCDITSSSCEESTNLVLVENCLETGCLDGACVGEGNHPPEFLEACRTISFIKDAVHTLDINTCFEDPDGDTLTFSVDGSDTQEIILSRSGNTLTFTPSAGFTGTENFSITTTDTGGLSTESGNISIEVKESSPPGPNPPLPPNPPPIPPPSPVLPVILSFYPLNINIEFNVSDENITFSIIAVNYTEIKWYLNGGLVAGVTGTSYTTGRLEAGNYTIRVDVINGEKLASKSWMVYVPLFPVNGNGGDKGKDRSALVYLIMIFVILVALIILVLLLVIKTILKREDGKEKKPAKLNSELMSKPLSEKDKQSF